MDGFTEKKWFVYLSDHHEGPFSLEEIQSKMTHGQLTSTNYVWAEGMSDWQMMSKVDAFGSILAPPPFDSAPAGAHSPAFEKTSSQASSELSPALAAVGPSSDFTVMSIEPQSATAAAVIASGPTLVAASEPAPEPEENLAGEAIHDDDSQAFQDVKAQKRALFGSMAKVGVLLIFLGVVGVAYNEGYLTPLLDSQTARSMIQSVTDLAEPVLTTLGISPIPKLDDVDPDEYQQLNNAAKASLSKVGPQFAVALSKGDLLSPTFYVASNLPDGAILDMYVEGVPDSLIGQLSLNAKTQVVIQKKLGRTGALQLPPGLRSLVRGQYTIYLVDPETQPPAVKAQLTRASAVQPMTAPTSVPKGLKVLFAKSYFLGGPQDPSYTQRLQEFHQRLTAKAQAELTELRQIEATYEAKLAETNLKFKALKKGKKVTARQKKLWAKYDSQWNAFYQQLTQMYSKLTPETAKTDYFYGFLYQLGQQTGDSLRELHVLQNSYFSGAVNTADPKAFEVQLGEVSGIAKSAIDTFKAKIEQVAAQPPTPNGLPKRDPI